MSEILHQLSKKIQKTSGDTILVWVVKLSKSTAENSEISDLMSMKAKRRKQMERFSQL
jgi:hypothetical protein